MLTRVVRVFLRATLVALQGPGACPVRADEQVQVAPPPSQVIELRIGIAQTVTLRKAFSSVHVADPKIIDLIPKTQNSALIIPKEIGVTSIVFDNQGDDFTNVVANVSATLFPMRVYDLNNLQSTTTYNCTPKNCVLADVKSVSIEPPAVTEEKIQRIEELKAIQTPP